MKHGLLLHKIENESLRKFLKFVQTNKAESDFTRRLNDMVETQKKVEELKKTYLSWSLHDSDVRREGRLLFAIAQSTTKV